MLPSPPWLGCPLWNICVTNDHGYVPLVVSTSRSFPHSRLITGFVTRLTLWVRLVEQESLSLLEHLNSSPVFSGFRVTQSLVLWVCFVDRCLSFCPFSFGQCFVFDTWILITSLWYLLTLLIERAETSITSFHFQRCPPSRLYCYRSLPFVLHELGARKAWLDAIAK